MKSSSNVQQKILEARHDAADHQNPSRHKLVALTAVTSLKETQNDKTNDEGIAEPSPRSNERDSSRELLRDVEAKSEERRTKDGKEKAQAKKTDDQVGDLTFDAVESTAEEKDNALPLLSDMTTSVVVDVETLYDCPIENCHDMRATMEPPMFLPESSDIELFHVVLSEDIEQLKHLLRQIAPIEMLDIVDCLGRTIYHYGALLKHKSMRHMIFQHVSIYHHAELEMKLQALMQQKAAINTAMNTKEWAPPRMKELQQEAMTHKRADWTSICNSRDKNGRSIFHYIATRTFGIPIDENEELASVLRAQPNILSAKDNLNKLALHYAVEAGNLKQVKWYFQMGLKLSQADVDVLLSFHVSRAMETVILRQLEAFDMHKYNSKQNDNDDGWDPGISTFALAKLHRRTDDVMGRLHQLPLHRAAKFGNIRAVELLLEAGADPNARDANQWTPLHFCADEATASHLLIAQLLMACPKSVDVNAKSMKGRSPLHIAVRSQKRQIAPDSTSTNICKDKDRLAFVDYLNECKADLNLKDERQFTPLLLACRDGTAEMIQFLLQAGCDPTATGDHKWNPLHFAAIRGNVSVLAFLLSWDADLRLWLNSSGIQGRKPLDLAQNDQVRHMLRNLWTECYKGNLDQVRSLLLSHSKQAFGQVNFASVKDTTSQAKRTPLHFAILGYADLLQSNESSRSHPLSQNERLQRKKAAEWKKSAPSRVLQIVILLLQAGADVCAIDKWKITPLMLAASIKDTLLMETLLDRFSDEQSLSVVDVNGNTALHYSYAFCQAQISTMLEDQMHDTDLENAKGKSPFEMTGYRDQIYPKDYREFLKQQQLYKQRQEDCK